MNLEDKDKQNEKYTIIEKLRSMINKKEPEKPATQEEIDQLKKDLEREKLKAELTELKNKNKKEGGLGKALKALRENLADPKDVHL